MARGPVWVSVDRAASVLRVHPETVRRWIRAGRLPADYVGGRRGYRLRWRLVKALAAGQQQLDAPAASATPPSRLGDALARALAAAERKAAELEALGAR